MKLKKHQVEGLLAAVYHELNCIFNPSEDSDFFAVEDATRKKRILKDLKHILENQFKHNLEDKAIFNLLQENQTP